MSNKPVYTPIKKKRKRFCQASWWIGNVRTFCGDPAVTSRFNPLTKKSICLCQNHFQYFQRQDAEQQRVTPRCQGVDK